MIKIGVVSLGCDKNRVDTEVMLYKLKENYIITDDEKDADVIIVNTCAFLESSRKEAIDTIFEMASLKKNGSLKKLIVTGCLPQKYISDIFEELPEVDAFLGTYDYGLICDAIEKVLDDKRVNYVDCAKEVLNSNRELTTPLHYAFLKIADGCDNHCTYCLIPSIRGRYISRTIESLVDEANSLVGKGVKELILVAQDVTNYGIDIYGEYKIVCLLKELSKIEELNSIRLLYCYPEKVSDELISEIKNNPKIVKYIDIPLQHMSTKVLKLMGRKGTYESYHNLMTRLIQEIPEIAIRTTFIIGFPGEELEDFRILEDFIREKKIVNAGFFAYSDEEEAASYKLKGKISDKEKQRRVKEITQIAEKTSIEILSKFLNREVSVVCDGFDFDAGMFYGRTYMSAPDIDTYVFFLPNGQPIEIGESYMIRINSLKHNDLYGELAIKKEI